MIVPDYLKAAAEIYGERNKLYGDNYKHMGFIFQRLFPEGITLNRPGDYNRFSVLMLMVMKVTRYANNFNNGGHNDSLDDLCVYSMMLKELDSERHIY